MLVIAHRGASAVEPENTILAIQAALDAKAAAIEFDVQGIEHQGEIKLIAIHDRFLERSTNGKGRVVDTDYPTLRALNAGKNQKIPTLWEKLKTIGEHHHQCLINIELKSENALAATLSDISRAINEYDLTLDQFLISSFYHPLLVLAKQQMPALKTGALIAHCPVNYAEFAQNLGCYSINLSVACINKRLVDDAHERGLKVYVYTVDHPNDIRDLINLQVDGIFSNHPEQAAKHVARLVDENTNS